MEALGYLRAQQHLQQAQWAGETQATMDNKSTVTRFLKHKDERHKKQWRNQTGTYGKQSGNCTRAGQR